MLENLQLSEQRAWAGGLFDGEGNLSLYPARLRELEDEIKELNKRGV